MTLRDILLASSLVALMATSACRTIPDPEPEPEPEPIKIEVEALTCIPPEQLERIVIPAVIKRGTYSTGIVDEPQYVTDPETGEVREIPVGVENIVEYENVIEPERIIWVNESGMQVTDICLPEGETPESYIPEE